MSKTSKLKKTHETITRQYKEAVSKTSKLKKTHETITRQYKEAVSKTSKLKKTHETITRQYKEAVSKTSKIKMTHETIARQYKEAVLKTSKLKKTHETIQKGCVKRRPKQNRNNRQKHKKHSTARHDATRDTASPSSPQDLNFTPCLPARHVQLQAKDPVVDRHRSQKVHFATLRGAGPVPRQEGGRGRAVVKHGADAAALNVPVPVRGVLAKRHAVHFVPRVGFRAAALEVQRALQPHDKVVPPDGVGRVTAVQIPDVTGVCVCARRVTSPCRMRVASG